MSPIYSMIWLFVIAGLLLTVPFALVLIWDSSFCLPGQGLSFATTSLCPSPGLFKNFISFFPFLMVIGAVLIGYNLKRISDSLLPPREESDTNEAAIRD
jgi:cytochrome bd-type quinol oxidase subunit 2